MTNTAATSIHAKHDGRVTAHERVDEQPAHAGDREDLLGDDQAAEERADVERHDRDERDQRVAEAVLEDHLAARHALGPGGADVVGESTSSIDARW